MSSDTSLWEARCAGNFPPRCWAGPRGGRHGGQGSLPSRSLWACPGTSAAGRAPARPAGLRPGTGEQGRLPAPTPGRLAPNSSHSRGGGVWTLDRNSLGRRDVQASCPEVRASAPGHTVSSPVAPACGVVTPSEVTRGRRHLLSPGLVCVIGARKAVFRARPGAEQQTISGPQAQRVLSVPSPGSL